MRALLVLLASLILAACGSTPGGGTAASGGSDGGGTAYRGTFDQRLLDTAQYGRLVIASVNYGKPSRSYLAQHESAVDRMVRERLVAAGYEVLPTDLFAQAWREGVRKFGEPYNPTTGKLNEVVFAYVLAETLQQLAAESKVQAVVFTSLEEMQVYFSPSGNHQAHFWGVTRRPSSRGGEGVPADFDWIQGVDAVGLKINVFDARLKTLPNGSVQLQPLFEGAGGIEVTEYLNLKPSKPVWTREKSVLDNESNLEEGIGLALQPWIRR